VGPKDPVLLRHQGEHPIVHVSGFHLIQESGAPVRLEMSPFELAVFGDGTLAFQGYPCGWGSPPTTTTISEPELTAVRELVAGECFQLQSSNAFCTDSGLVQIRCSAGSQTRDLRSSCESDEDFLAWRVFANRVRRVLRIEDRSPAASICDDSGSKLSLAGSEIELTISPLVIITKTYGVRPR
jgi:hypothetical protein